MKTTTDFGLQLHNLCFGYGSPGSCQSVLQDVQLQVRAGHTAAILGSSGGGKTTILRLITGHLQPWSGQINIGGGDALTVPPHLRSCAWVPQNGGLFPHLTVWQNIAFGITKSNFSASRLRRRPTDPNTQWIKELLELSGIADLWDRHPAELSGGQASRVALARALAVRPALVLLDEPFSALDTQLRTTMIEHTAQLLQRFSTTAVLVTHDPAEAQALADKVYLLADKKLVAAN